MNGKVVAGILVVLVLVLGVWFAVSFFEVEATGEFDMPEVNIETEAGQIPEVEVRGPDVRIDTKKVEVPVPDVDVDVDMKDTEIDVPDIDIQPPLSDAETPQ